MKSSKFRKEYERYEFNTGNKYREEIEIYYFLAFNEDYTKLMYAWRVPGEIVEKETFQVGLSVTNLILKIWKNMILQINLETYYKANILLNKLT